MKNIILGLTLMVVFSNLAWAHERHDKTPGLVNAPHGGIIQGTDHLYWELVNDASGIKLYPLTHDLTAIALKEVATTANFQLPKKSNKEDVKLEAEEDHYGAKINAKGAHRYTLEVISTYKGRKEKVKFQVEPQG